MLLREADELNQDVARAMGLSGAIRVTGREGTVKPHGAPHPVSAMVPASGWKGTCAGVPRAAPIDGRVLLAEGDRAVCWVREHGGVRVAVMADLSRPHDAVGAVQRRAVRLAGLIALRAEACRGLRAVPSNAARPHRCRRGPERSRGVQGPGRPALHRVPTPHQACRRCVA